MKVLLVSTNQLRPTDASPLVPVEPLGLAYVASSVSRAGHDVSFLDLCFSDDAPAELAGEIGRFGPDVIGISFRNVEMMAYFHDVTFTGELREIVGACRMHSDAAVILGGSGFSVMPAPLLALTGADLGIVGEGEWSLPRVLEALEKGGDPSGLPGTVRIEGGEARFAPPDPCGNLADLPPPARERIDHGAYRAAGGVASLQTKRGCPFKCIYCTYPLIEGPQVRCREPAEVAREFRLLAERYGATDLYIVDNQFNYPIDHAKAVCAELISMRNEVKIWWRCMLNPGAVDDDLVFLLRASRCATVDFGIESAHDGMLRNLGKSHTREDIRRALALFDKYGLPYDSWILFGGPGETEDTVRETMDFLDGLDVPRVLFSIGVRVCPGTALERLMRGGGALEPENDLLAPVFYCAFDAEAIAGIVEPYCAGREGWQIAALRHQGESAAEEGGSNGGAAAQERESNGGVRDG